MDLHFRNFIQLASLLATTYSIIVLVMWARRVITRRLWATFPLTFLLHTFVFYSYVLLTCVWQSLPTGFLIDWGAVVRLHGYICAAAIIFMLNKLNGRLDGHV